MPRRPAYRYACIPCNTQDAVLNLDHPYDDVCADCGSACEKTALCECGLESTWDGTDMCLSCWTDTAINDPSDFENFGADLQMAVAKEMAERLQVKPVRLQAPRPVAA